MRVEIGKQGTWDGLCGIYCLANAIRSWDRLQHCEDPGRESFRLIIEAADRSGLLASDKICRGYEWYELVEIFDFFVSRVRYPGRALSLDEALATVSGNSRISKVRELVTNGYQLILSVDSDDHWILANRVSNGSVYSDDPWPGAKKARKINTVQNYPGVAIETPKDRQ